MKTALIMWLCLLVCAAVSAVPPQNFDRTSFYSILKWGNSEEMDKELLKVDASSVIEKNAYKGTLLMRKAGLVKKPREKLALFKEGRIKLETEIRRDSSNPEYHFLRLIIQEHAPKITKYSAQIQEDKDIVIKKFSTLPVGLQNIIVNYSKTSAVLHPSDF